MITPSFKEYLKLGYNSLDRASLYSFQLKWFKLKHINELCFIINFTILRTLQAIYGRTNDFSMKEKCIKNSKYNVYV
jgi:hypothetical protein